MPLFIQPLGGTVYINSGVAAGNNSFALDVNGATQLPLFISTVSAGGTITITPAYFGVFYNIKSAGTYTVALAATQPASNIGKYNLFRNNSGAAISITITGGTGITSPLTVANQQSVTFAVDTINSYALF
jgi:hypothetical protein